MSRAALAALALLAATGCFHTRFQTDLPAGGQRYLEPAPFFFWGLAGSKELNLEEMCPNGVAHWDTWAEVDDLFVGLITLGIYSPRTVEVECAGAIGANAP